MKKANLKLLGENDFFVEEAFKVLRTNLQLCGSGVRVIGVTSCTENEGKTSVSLHTAKSFSDLGKKVLVIDTDMRQSVIAARNTDITDATGLSEVLTGLKSFDECVYEMQYPGMHLLLAGQYPPNPVELLNSQEFAALLEKVREMYDYVIIDTPPVGVVIDAAVVASRCDGMVLVIRGSRVRSRQAKNAVEQLKRTGCRILGVVRKEMRGSKKHHSDPYGYGQHYGQAKA